MKLIAKYLKPFALVVLACLVLLFGQAMCDLSLPNLMSDIVNVGIQQNGIEEGAPEAMSEKAMALLKLMMDEKDQELMGDNYLTIEPESIEAQRYAETYPLAREETFCVLKENISEEAKAELDAVYGKSAYAFMLYMKKAQESGELESMGKDSMQDSEESGKELPPNLAVPNPESEESSLPNGVIGEIPKDALMTTTQEVGSELDMQQLSAISGGKTEMNKETVSSTEPMPSETQPDTTETAPNPETTTGTAGGMDFSGADGYSNMDINQLYMLIPLLDHAPAKSIKAAIDEAASSDTMMSAQVGVTFKKLFYTELGMDIAPIQSAYILQTGFKMLGVALLGVMAAILVGFLSSLVAAKIGKKLRHDLFAKVENFSNAEFDKFSTASLITRTTNDVQQVQMLITMGLRMVCYAPIMGIGGIIFAVGKSVSMSWIIAAAVVVLIGVICIALALAMPKFKRLQKLIDKLNLVSRENLSGMMVVRAFGNEKYEEERFDSANKNLADTNRYVQRVMSAMMPAMMLIMNITSIVIVWVGGYAIADSALQVGDMMAFIQYSMQIIMSFLMIAMMFIMVPRASVSAVRISEVLNTELEIKDLPEPKKLEEIKGRVEFKDVSFRYSNAESDVLENISFTANPGETTAFIGATGSGKSTLINLIPRFYDVTGGEILLDGADIRSIAQADLRNSIGYVPQKGLLFSGTIESNIKYGKEDADSDEILKAVEVAQAKEFVEETEVGVESSISQGGSNVSGGQKQRLAIARALVRKAPIYIFDDSFSALDFKTDAALRRALKKNTAESTVLIVAQRVSTIMHAEQIIVLDSGRMVGRGTHKELLDNCPEYREIAESQLQKEELE